MPHLPELRGGLLSDLVAIEQRIARSTAESADDSLDRSEKRYRHLVENSLGLICTHDLDGMVLSVNPAAANSLGYEPRDGIGRNLREFLSPGTRHRFDNYLARIRENAHDSGVMRVVRKDGTERIWLYRNVLYAEPGVRPYVLGHAIDVTERAAAETAVRRSQLQTLEATSRLAGRVAHAFNNLLTVIIGSTEMLLADESANEKTCARLDAIMRAAARGATVTRQLLAVGRQQPIDRTALDLNAVVTRLEPALRHVIGSKAILTLRLDPALPYIDGDSAQMEQVLLHLAGNAAEAMTEGGSIVIETATTLAEEVRARNHPDSDPGEYVWLTVRDTGRGMDAHTRDHLFEPFFTTKSGGFSAGLGLPVVYGIVHQLDGTIGIDSEVGKGTAVTIALKRAAVHGSREAAKSTGDDDEKAAPTIVLVDDEDDVRAVMRSVLQQKGYVVLEASSGGDAIQLLADHSGSIDMLVTDVLMPGMSGPELYEHLERRHPGLKVLYVSGYADDAFGREPGRGAALLSKPFSLETLAKRVQDELSSL